MFSSVFYWFYRISINIALEDLYKDLTAISNTAATGLDGDLHQALYEDANYDVSQEWPLGMNDERYWEMAEWLYLVHQSNPRALLYTYVSPEPGKVEFVVSMGPLLDPVTGAEFREPYWPQPPSVILNGLKEVTLSKNVVTDQWGSWVSGFTPLYNSKNEIVAAVGVDYRADIITEIEREIRFAAIPTFVISYFIMLVLVINLTNRTVNPVISLSKAATQIGDGKLVKVNHTPGIFRDEISTLTEIFNTMAEKIQERREHSIALYQDNIQRHEHERMKLAHNLHDEVLNGLAALSMAIDDEHVGPQFQQDYEDLTFRIRQIINGLRPPTLDHGLHPALETLVQDLTSRPLENVSIVFDVEKSRERYESSVEGHLFRIVQQACENSIQHANAIEIRISGSLKEANIHLIIEDNGVGFYKDKILARTHDSEHRHYGLVVMQERAELINANLIIESTPGVGTRVEIILSDILHEHWERSARIKAETALLESEMVAQGLMNVAPDIVFLLNCDGEIINANDAACNRFNLRHEDLIGHNVWDLLPDNITQKRKPGFDQVIETGKPTRFEDGTQNTWIDHIIYPILNDYGSVTKIAVFARDITERKHSEQALKESEENFRAIAENANDGILIANENGKHVFANQRASDITGYSINELLETNLSDLTHPEELTKITKRFQSRLSGENPINQYKTIILGKDGNTIPIEMTAAQTIWNRKSAVIAIIREIPLRDKKIPAAE